MSTEPNELRVEAVGPDAWERVRAIRLRALREDPDAFGRRLCEEEDRSAAAWRERLVDAESVTFLATDGAADVGLVTGAPFRGEVGAAGLFGMWVGSEARGRGVGDALVCAVLDWARERGHERVLLDVGDDNAAAIALYERHGFVPSGVRGTLPPPREHIPEHQRVRELRGEAAAEGPPGGRG